MFSRITRRSRAGKGFPEAPIENSPTANGDLFRRAPRKIEIDGRGDIYSIAFLADGEQLVSGGHEGKVRRWQLKDGSEVGKPMDAGARITNVTGSPDRKWFISATTNGRVTVWSTQDHEKVTEIDGHTNVVCAVDVSPDSMKIATGSQDETACVWDISTGDRLLGPLKHENNLAAVKFSPSGEFIATATWWHNSIRIYNSRNGRLLVDVPITVNSPLNQSLAWSPNGEHLFALSYDGTIRCLHGHTGNSLSQWLIHSSDNPRCIALASNGKFLAASANSSVSFWDMTTHKQIGSILEHTDAVCAIALSADNHYLASGGPDKKTTLHSLRSILPQSYFVDIDPHEQEFRRVKRESVSLQTTIDHIRMQDYMSLKEVANLKAALQQSESEKTELNEKLAAAHDLVNERKNEVDRLSTAFVELRERQKSELRARYSLEAEVVKARQEKNDLLKVIDSLRADLHTYEQKLRCEALYAKGRINEAAECLLSIMNAVGEQVGTNELLTRWITEFRPRCAAALEGIGDMASGDKKHDRAVTAYSTALSLSLPTSSSILMKWTSTMLVIGSVNEILGAASKFKLPAFTIYQAVCEAFEGAGNVTGAIEWLQKMTTNLANDTTMQDERERWLPNFRQRLIEMLETLSARAMDSKDYHKAVKLYSTILSLNPTNRNDVLLKRSKAQALMHQWEEALKDADEAITLDPSCYQGYEKRHAALHGSKRYAEAFEAFKVMLTNIEQSPDPHVRDLRHQYVDATSMIRDVIGETIRQMPRVLIDTDTGLLHDKSRQAAAFEALPIYSELLSSMTRRLDRPRICGAVEEFYRYVMLSHRWDYNEPLFQKVEDISIYKLAASPGNTKLQKFCSFVHSFGFRWAWSDTCCVDKTNHVVLQESLVAMFTWYCGASLTIVYLHGVRSQSQKIGDLGRSVWNTRGWTFQEYVASKVVQFYTEDWKPYLGLDRFNHKESPTIVSEMENATGVSAQDLVSLRPGLDRVREKLYLASMRQTTLVEDIAYSLFGIFNLGITVMYGEGNRAVGRLLENILSGSGDVAVLAWTGRSGSYNSCLPSDLTVYHKFATSHIPSPLNNTDMTNALTELHASLCDPALAEKLYDHVNNLPVPQLVASRLRLPGIVFPLAEFVLASEQDPNTRLRVYCATTSALGDVEIQTAENLSVMKDLLLVHPWIRPLLDQEFSEGVGALDKTTRALRFVARLRQPFGALLLAPLSRVEYRRVATDSLLMMQVRDETSLKDLIDNVRTIDIQ
ncbi:hypothetical protein OG21DRAFT_1514089 [Imleria badia]|nr:hypothetical protein OG21DRAFT_1514089 [Imleria badia]